MARAGHNDRCSSGPEAVPPFWLCADTHVIDQRVFDVARDNWTWAFWLIKKQLHDGPRTPDIVEDVAVDVSSRLRADSEVGRNLSGYFRTAMIQRVKTLATRDGRITYEGDAQDLEVEPSAYCPGLDQGSRGSIGLAILSALYVSSCEAHSALPSARLLLEADLPAACTHRKAS